MLQLIDLAIVNWMEVDSQYWLAKPLLEFVSLITMSLPNQLRQALLFIA